MSVSVTSNINEIIYDAKKGDWPISKVTVYGDQAEVCRRLKFKPEQEANYFTTVIRLKNLPDTLNPDSVRADISSKNARLQEVSYDSVWVDGETDKEEVKRIKAIEKELKILNRLSSRLQRRKALITQHENSALNLVDVNGFNASNQTIFDVQLLNKVSAGLEMYKEMKTEVETKINETLKRISELNQEVTGLRTEHMTNMQGKYVREVAVLLEIPQIFKGRDIELELFYVVSGAKWLASYDIKVERNVDKVELSYYGQVTNSTGEDWNDINISLSTAKPSVGGALPPLPRYLVDYKVYQPTVNNELMGQIRGNNKAYNGMLSRKLSVSNLAQNLSQFNNFAPQQQAYFGNMNGTNQVQVAEQALLPSTAEAEGDAGSTVFNIQRLATIESDSKWHKLTISLVQLDALFTHACSPKVSPDVFLKCSTKNNSKFSFLPGVMSVFIDGSFITNSAMQLVRVNEDFGFFLGIDDSVKLDYKPEVVKNSISTTGVMTKVKKNLRVIGRDIVVKNTADKPINCVIYEQLPFSNDGKVKVELRSPQLNSTGPERFLVNGFNNLEARYTIKEQSSWKLTFEFSVEWPENEQISFYKMKDHQV